MKRNYNMTTRIVGALAILGAALILAVRTYAGADGGPLIGEGHTVAANARHSYSITFRGGETAEVEAIGNGDIDLYVYDHNGRLVTKDDDPDSYPMVSFRPSTTQTYRVVIENCEDHDSTYDIETN